MKRARCFLPLAAFAALLLCLVCAGLAAYALPRQAERSFGPPAPGLSLRRRLALSLSLLQNRAHLTAPAGTQDLPTPFEVSLGESPQQVAGRLEQAGLVSDAAALVDYMVYAGLDTSLQAGEYTLNPHMTPLEIARALQDATPSEITFRILPGWRLEEVAEALPTSGLTFEPGLFLEAARAPLEAQRVALGLPEGASLEGFLFPDRYRLPRAATLDEFLAALTQNFQVKLDPALQQAFEDQGLTLHQAVTLASLVQREAMRAEEMPVIASVFLNRLADGMRLDSDPTVQYALGYHPLRGSWWKSPLSLDDLQIRSPYNTYQIAGLPPGPICSPGLEALQAVGRPQQTPYYFFRAACDGSGRHNFAQTFEEHQANACP
ncbi:MAG: endolytic transglycosylase MltG [Chloroflexota bacterium]